LPLPHVFISYVRQNRDEVDRLAEILRNNGVTVWLDRNNLEPGTRWRIAIKRAIQNGNFFIACFSHEYSQRDRTYMSEEITVAIDELRLRPSDRTWFIPVLLNETTISTRQISNSEYLEDIQAIKLYEDWNDGISRILKVLKYDDPIQARLWHLIEICERPFPEDRLHAIRELSQLEAQAKPALSVLTKAIKEDKYPDIKKAALAALKNMGRDAVPALNAALEDPETDIRWRAADALANIGPEAAEAVSALASKLDDPDHHVRSSAANALVKIGPHSVPALVAAVRHHDRDVGFRVVDALGKIGPEAAEAASVLVNTLKHPDCYYFVNEVADCIAKIGANAVPALVDAVNDRSMDSRVIAPGGFLNTRVIAAGVLGRMGPDAVEAVPALISALSDHSDGMRLRALEALGKIGPKAAEAVPALTAVLKDKDSHFLERHYAAEALGRIGPKAAEAVPALTAALKEIRALPLRCKAAVALGNIGPSAAEAVPALILILEKNNINEARWAAAEALGKIGPKAAKAVPALSAVLRLNWQDEELLERAAAALKKIQV
jgi:HEAT repeat protein